MRTLYDFEKYINRPLHEWVNTSELSRDQVFEHHSLEFGEAQTEK